MKKVLGIVVGFILCSFVQAKEFVFPTDPLVCAQVEIYSQRLSERYLEDPLGTMTVMAENLYANHHAIFGDNSDGDLNKLNQRTAILFIKEFADSLTRYSKDYAAVLNGRYDLASSSAAAALAADCKKIKSFAAGPFKTQVMQPANIEKLRQFHFKRQARENTPKFNEEKGI